jgi:hypothetical protein
MSRPRAETPVAIKIGALPVRKARRESLRSRWVVRNIIKEELDKKRPLYDSSGDDDSDVSL